MLSHWPHSPSFYDLPFQFYSWWLKLGTGVRVTCEQLLHLLKQQFTPKTALRDTIIDVGRSRKTERKSRTCVTLETKGVPELNGRFYWESESPHLFVWCMFLECRNKFSHKCILKSSVRGDFGVDCLFKLVGKAEIFPMPPSPLEHKSSQQQIEVCIGTVFSLPATEWQIHMSSF